MTDNYRIKKYYFITFTIGFFTLFSILFIPQAISAENEYHGYYEYTMYLDSSAFTGNTHIESQTITDTISTYFGTYSQVRVTTRSPYKLSHPSKGFIEISNSNSYFDAIHKLRKSESTWKLRLSGYQQVVFTMTYEYGNYEVLQSNETVYEETYDQRYYEDGILEDSTNCRDYSFLETVENITVKAGTYECECFRTNFYEDEVLQGYSKAWGSEGGTLIKQTQYDSSDDLVMVVTLISESKPVETWIIVLSVFAGISVAIVGSFVYIRVRNKRRLSNYNPYLSDKGENKPNRTFG